MDRDEYLLQTLSKEDLRKLHEQENAETMLDAASETCEPVYSDEDLNKIADALRDSYERVKIFRNEMDFYTILMCENMDETKKTPWSIIEKHAEQLANTFERNLNSIDNDGHFRQLLRSMTYKREKSLGRSVASTTVAISGLIEDLRALQAESGRHIGTHAGEKGYWRREWAFSMLEIFETILQRPAGRSHPGGPFTRGLQAAGHAVGEVISDAEARSLVVKYKQEKARQESAKQTGRGV